MSGSWITPNAGLPVFVALHAQARLEERCADAWRADARPGEDARRWLERVVSEALLRVPDADLRTPRRVRLRNRVVAVCVRGRHIHTGRPEVQVVTCYGPLPGNPHDIDARPGKAVRIKEAAR